MSKITGLKPGKTRAKRINVYLDDKFAISVSQETAVKENLGVGRELGRQELEALEQKDLRQRCYNSAVRFLGYRPRSESEIRQRLQRKDYDVAIIEKTLTRLRDEGLADDAGFARFWVENRETFSPRSRQMTKMELKRKGLEPEIIEQAVSGVDDKRSAYRTALSRARRFTALDYGEFRRRMTDYLARRGFNYGVTREVTEKVWKELKSKNSDLPESPV